MKNRPPCRIALVTMLVVLAAGVVACLEGGEAPVPEPARPRVVSRGELEAMTVGEILELGVRRLRWEEDRGPPATREEAIEWFLADQELQEVGDWALWGEMGYFDPGYIGD